MNLPESIEEYGTEEKCREYLEALRWPDGIECPRCEKRSISRIEKRNQYDCNSCRYQFSVTAGTLFHDSHLPLWKWFLGIYLIGESKKGISGKQLERTLGISYKTAWYLGHRIRAAMEEDSPIPLRGIVEVDETWLGGKRPDHPVHGPWANKQMVLGAVERGGTVRLRVEDRGDRKTLRGFVEDTVHDDAEEWVRADVHTNTIEGVWSLLKRSVVGTYHQLSVKNLPAYLDEVAFKFDNRNNPYLFRDTLLRLIDGETLPFRELDHGESA